MTKHEAEVADDVWNPRFLASSKAAAHALIEAEAERTAAHWRRTCNYVAFYGLFYVRREAWPKERRWQAWERARELVSNGS